MIEISKQEHKSKEKRNKKAFVILSLLSILSLAAATTSVVLFTLNGKSGGHKSWITPTKIEIVGNDKNTFNYGTQKDIKYSIKTTPSNASDLVHYSFEWDHADGDDYDWFPPNDSFSIDHDGNLSFKPNMIVPCMIGNGVEELIENGIITAHSALDGDIMATKKITVDLLAYSENLPSSMSFSGPEEINVIQGGNSPTYFNYDVAVTPSDTSNSVYSNFSWTGIENEDGYYDSLSLFQGEHENASDYFISLEKNSQSGENNAAYINNSPRLHVSGSTPVGTYYVDISIGSAVRVGGLWDDAYSTINVTCPSFYKNKHYYNDIDPNTGLNRFLDYDYRNRANPYDKETDDISSSSADDISEYFADNMTSGDLLNAVIGEYATRNSDESGFEIGTDGVTINDLEKDDNDNFKLDYTFENSVNNSVTNVQSTQPLKVIDAYTSNSDERFNIRFAGINDGNAFQTTTNGTKTYSNYLTLTFDSWYGMENWGNLTVRAQ